MDRESTSSLDKILLATVRRLINTVPKANRHNTYISTVPEELPASSAEIMYEVSPDVNMMFEDGHFTGAGRSAVHCQTNIRITIHLAIQTDKQGWDVEYLTNYHRGAIRRIFEVLSALSEHELSDEEGVQLLSQPMRPKSCAIPPKDDRKRGYISLFFAIEFDWAIPVPDLDDGPPDDVLP